MDEPQQPETAEVSDADAGENPTSSELDIEGPNESAPGHEPDDDDSGSSSGDRPAG